jgi:hypothetical protein
MASRAAIVERRWYCCVIMAAIVAAIVLPACSEMAISARTEKVIPESSLSSALPEESRAKSVVVAPVTGALRSTLMDFGLFSETFPFAPENFQSALAETLRRSRLFVSVATDGSADYRLEANVLKGSARPEAIFSTEKSSLFVAYRLVDLKTGGVVWQDDYYSESVAPFTSEGPAVGKEETVRKNLEQLVRGLSTADLRAAPSAKMPVQSGGRISPATVGP